MPEIRTGTVTVWRQLSPVLATFRLAPQKRRRFSSYEAGQYMALRREDCRLTRRVSGPDGRTRFLPDLDETGRQKRGPVGPIGRCFSGLRAGRRQRGPEGPHRWGLGGSRHSCERTRETA
jgi:hypothetical protein